VAALHPTVALERLPEAAGTDDQLVASTHINDADEAQQVVRRSCKAEVESSSVSVGSVPVKH
jgi:hypothetical protein